MRDDDAVWEADEGCSAARAGRWTSSPAAKISSRAAFDRESGSTKGLRRVTAPRSASSRGAHGVMRWGSSAGAGAHEVRLGSRSDLDPSRQSSPIVGGAGSVVVKDSLRTRAPRAAPASPNPTIRVATWTTTPNEKHRPQVRHSRHASSRRPPDAWAADTAARIARSAVVSVSSRGVPAGRGARQGRNVAVVEETAKCDALSWGRRVEQRVVHAVVGARGDNDAGDAASSSSRGGAARTPMRSTSQASGHVKAGGMMRVTRKRGRPPSPTDRRVWSDQLAVRSSSASESATRSGRAPGSRASWRS